MALYRFRQFRDLVLASASRAVVGLGVQQTHIRGRLPRACVILCLCHFCIPVYTMRKAVPDPDIFQLLLINRTALSSGLGPAVGSAGCAASREEGLDGGGSCFCFTCTHCHVLVGMD